MEVLDPVESWYEATMDILGDFINVLNREDRIGGNIVTLNEVRDFQECIKECLLEEMRRKGQHYTWIDKGFDNRVFSKID